MSRPKSQNPRSRVANFRLAVNEYAEMEKAAQREGHAKGKERTDAGGLRGMGGGKAPDQGGGHDLNRRRFDGDGDGIACEPYYGY